MRENGTGPAHPRIVRLAEVTRLTGISRSSIYRLMELGEFPQRVRLGVKAVGWRENEVEAWIAARTAVRGNEGGNSAE